MRCVLGVCRSRDVAEQALEASPITGRDRYSSVNVDAGQVGEGFARLGEFEHRRGELAGAPAWLFTQELAIAERGGPGSTKPPLGRAGLLAQLFDTPRQEAPLCGVACERQRALVGRAGSFASPCSPQ